MDINDRTQTLPGLEEKPKRKRASLLDLYIDEIKEALQRGVPTPRITKDINAKLPEHLQFSEAGVYRFTLRRGLRANL